MRALVPLEGALLLPVQRALQHQFRLLAAIWALYHGQGEGRVAGELVSQQRVAAHVRVLCHLQRETRPGRDPFTDLEVQSSLAEDRGVVVDVLDGHLDVENVERVLHERLEADGAGRRLAAHLLPVQPLAHVQLPALRAHREVFQLPFSGSRHPQLACRQLRRAQPQVPRQRPHQRASAQLLGDGVADPRATGPLLPVLNDFTKLQISLYENNKTPCLNQRSQNTYLGK
uniref:Uncharacterized protein n=1 Tax=Strix occidentalis caurina TaxID=311401 RepID=A0A8D0EJG3_STROC